MKDADLQSDTRGRTRRPLARAVWVLGAVFALASVGCASRSVSPPPPDADPSLREPYVIGVADVLNIRVWKNQELSVPAVVRMDGKISVPLLDDVQAEGLTPMELKQVLARELSEFITAPDVTVVVAQMNSRFISVLGTGTQTTRVPLNQNLRVLEAIAAVGGFSAFADRSDIRIVRRQEDGSELEYRFDYDAYVKGKAPGTNIVLQNRDVILIHD